MCNELQRTIPHPFHLSKRTQHVSRGPVRVAVHRTLAGTVIRTSCVNEENAIVVEHRSAVRFAGPKQLHIAGTRTRRNKVSSTHGPVLVGVFFLVNVNRGTKDNFSIVQTNYSSINTPRPLLRILAHPSHMGLMMQCAGLNKSIVAPTGDRSVGS